MAIYLETSIPNALRNINDIHSGYRVDRNARVVKTLSGRLAGRRALTVLAIVIATNSQSTNTRREERERIILGLGRVEVVRGASGGRTVVSR